MQFVLLQLTLALPQLPWKWKLTWVLELSYEIWLKRNRSGEGRAHWVFWPNTYLYSTSKPARKILILGVFFSPKMVVNDTKKQPLGLEADDIMSSSLINGSLLSCNCYPAKKFVPLWIEISRHENNPTVRCILALEATSQRTFTRHTTLRMASQAHALKPWTVLHDWGDSVPCDQARERSMEQSHPCQRVPRGAAAPAARRGMLVFNREKGTFTAVHTSRTHSGGGVNACF